MEPNSVAPTYKRGDTYRMPDHIRNADHISYRGSGAQHTHRSWTPPEENPGQAFARTVADEHPEAKTVYWPEGQTPDREAERTLERRRVKNITKNKNIEDIL